jgi:hypothetical protein
MAHGVVFDLFKQERHERAPVASDAENYLQVRLVHGASHTLRNGQRRREA